MVVDTLKLYERFSRTGIPDAAAKEIAEAFKETNDELFMRLATKEDLRAEIERAKSDIIKWVAAMLVGQAALVATIVKLF